MAKKTIEELELDLAAVTSKLTLIDQILDASKLGVDMQLVFRCNHSGLHFPSDYIREWGRVYGSGLGPDPISEVLDTDYNIPPPAITPEIHSLDQIMHPVYHPRAQMDLMLVNAPLVQMAVVMREDIHCKARGKIILAKQLKNKKSQLPIMAVAWERARNR